MVCLHESNHYCQYWSHGHINTDIYSYVSLNIVHYHQSSLVLTSPVPGDGGGERAGLQIRGCEGPVPLDVLLSAADIG